MERELRIGNYITSKSSSLDYWEVTASDIEHISDNPSHYTPIPLTEEWLVKLNVNEEKEQNVFRINYVNYHKGTNTFNYCISYFFDENGYVDNCFNEVKYVHQLQNLYFALTGEELTINE